MVKSSYVIVPNEESHGDKWLTELRATEPMNKVTYDSGTTRVEYKLPPMSTGAAAMMKYDELNEWVDLHPGWPQDKQARGRTGTLTRLYAGKEKLIREAGVTEIILGNDTADRARACGKRFLLTHVRGGGGARSWRTLVFRNDPMIDDIASRSCWPQKGGKQPPPPPPSPLLGEYEYLHYGDLANIVELPEATAPAAADGPATAAAPAAAAPASPASPASPFYPTPAASIQDAAAAAPTASVLHLPEQPSRKRSKVSGVYVLDLAGGHKYVGKSDDVHARIRQHKESSSGSAWCKKHRVIGLYGKVLQGDIDELSTLETQRFVEMGLEFGFDKVRGAQWSQVALTGESIRQLQQHIAHEHDCCFRCGTKDAKTGHHVCKEAEWFAKLSSMIPPTHMQQVRANIERLLV